MPVRAAPMPPTSRGGSTSGWRGNSRTPGFRASVGARAAGAGVFRCVGDDTAAPVEIDAAALVDQRLQLPPCALYAALHPRDRKAKLLGGFNLRQAFHLDELECLARRG